MSTSPAPTVIPFTSARNRRGVNPVSEAALANEAQPLNVPLNPRAWDGIPSLTVEDRDLLAWFHQTVIDKRYTGAKIGEILGYDRTNAGRILRGVYPVADWQPILSTIRDWKARQSRPMNGMEIEPVFVPSADDDRLYHGMEYAARGGFTILAGDSGVGKTKTVLEWDQRNPGRLIRVNAPASGGPSALLALIAQKMGMGWRKPNYLNLYHAITNRLTDRSILVIDQGSRLIPDARKVQAKSLEVLMDFSEDTGCGIVIPLTWRAVQSMGDMRYQIEQITGRAEIFLAPPPTRDQVAAIAAQFGTFTQGTLSELHKLALAPGALRTVVKILNAAALASKKVGAKTTTDAAIKLAIKHRFERMGNEDPFARSSVKIAWDRARAAE